MTLATVCADGTPHATTVSFVSDDLVLYFAAAIDSEKAHDLAKDGRIAATVNLPYKDWSQIQGLSLHGTGSFVKGLDEQKRIAALLLKKFPQYRSVIDSLETVPWPGLLFIRVVPDCIAIIDYTVKFGHVTYHKLMTE